MVTAHTGSRENLSESIASNERASSSLPAAGKLIAYTLRYNSIPTNDMVTTDVVTIDVVTIDVVTIDVAFIVRYLHTCCPQRDHSHDKSPSQCPYLAGFYMPHPWSTHSLWPEVSSLNSTFPCHLSDPLEGTDWLQKP